MLAVGELGIWNCGEQLDLTSRLCAAGKGEVKLP